MKERLINRNLSFPTDNQSAEVLQPCKSTLNRPSSLVTPHFAAILMFLFLVIPTIWANQINAPFSQSFTKRVAVISPICNNTNRIFSGTPASMSGHRNFFNRRFQQFHLTRRGRIEMSTERDSLAIDHHHPLRTFSAFGLSDALAPFFAEAKLPSAKVSSQSSWPCSSSSDKNLRQIFSQTPCSSHCCNRRQQVLADGYRSGRSFHLAPLRKTQTMPSKTSRLLRGLRPPLGDCVWTGNKGSNFSHCSSVINDSCVAIKNSFLQQSVHKSLPRASLKYIKF
jgi:hypothetical protein